MTLFFLLYFIAKKRSQKDREKAEKLEKNQRKFAK